MDIESNISDFSERTLIPNAKQLDFDSAIRRFESFNCEKVREMPGVSRHSPPLPPSLCLRTGRECVIPAACLRRLFLAYRFLWVRPLVFNGGQMRRAGRPSRAVCLAAVASRSGCEVGGPR